MKLRKILCIIGIIVAVICILFMQMTVFLMGGPDYTTYPSEKASLWVCEDPYFQISYSSTTPECYLEWNGEVIPVEVGLRSNTFSIWENIPGDNVPIDEIMLIRGNWKYVGNTMVFEIETDNIFDGSYTKLVFIPQE